MIVIKEHKKLLLNLKDPERVTTVIPTARAMLHNGKTLVSVPHRLDEVRVLRNLGFDAPNPMGSYYDYPHGLQIEQPFALQKVTSEFMVTNPRCFNLNGMGSGKTLTGLWSFDYLRKAGIVDWCVVVTSLSTVERAWGDEIFRNFFDMTFAVVHGTRDKRHKLLNEKFDVYIINHDGIKNEDTTQLLINKPGRGVFIIDEVAEFRNAATDRWKFLNRILNGKKNPHKREWVWGFTGTPMPKAPTDAWAQTKLINPSNAPMYFGAFRDLVMNKITKFKYTAKSEALTIVRNMMQPAVRYPREAFVDLPPTTFVTRYCPLSSDQKRAYDEMMQKLKTEYLSGQITAANEVVKVNKLVQICCGVAYAKDGTDVNIPAKPRMDLLKEIIEQAGAKVLIFVPITAALEHVAAELSKEYTVGVVHGGISKTERNQIFQDFQLKPTPQIIVAAAGTMSHGLTLTAADTTVWFGPINSNNTYQQANARTARPGQKLATMIVNIESTPIERKMFDRLQKQESMQGTLLGMFKDPTS